APSGFSAEYARGRGRVEGPIAPASVRAGTATWARAGTALSRGRSAQHEPAQQRQRWRAVDEARLEVAAVDEAGRLTVAADDARRGDRLGGARRDRLAPADLVLQVPERERPDEVGRQLGRREARPVVLRACGGLLLEAAVDHERDGLALAHPVGVDPDVDQGVDDRAEVELPVSEEERRVVRPVALVHH